MSKQFTKFGLEQSLVQFKLLVRGLSFMNLGFALIENKYFVVEILISRSTGRKMVLLKKQIPLNMYARILIWLFNLDPKWIPLRSLPHTKEQCSHGQKFLCKQHHWGDSFDSVSESEIIKHEKSGKVTLRKLTPDI